MKRPVIQDKVGFTLIELMIAMTISIAMVGFIGITYTSNAKRYIHSREKSQAQMHARLSLDFISDELRETGYALTWDATPDVRPFGVNEVIPGAAVDPQTDSITLRYAIAPLTAASPSTASLIPQGANPSPTLILVTALPFAIPSNGLIALYSPPTTVSVHEVASARSVGDTSVTLLNPPLNPFNPGDLLVLVQENSFWVQDGNLMMRTGGSNIRLASNIEDFQIALIDRNEAVIGDISSAGFAAMTSDQIRNVRAVRLSITSRSSKPVIDMPPAVPPSLEDHDRSGESADQLLRGVERTTIYLRNFGVLGP